MAKKGDGPGREARSVEFAGWRDPKSGDWVDNERPRAKDEYGAPAIKQEPDAEVLQTSDQIVVRWVDEDGEVHYRTTGFVTADFDVQAWLSDHYGVEFA